VGTAFSIGLYAYNLAAFAAGRKKSEVPQIGKQESWRVFFFSIFALRHSVSDEGNTSSSTIERCFSLPVKHTVLSPVEQIYSKQFFNYLISILCFDNFLFWIAVSHWRYWQSKYYERIESCLGTNPSIRTIATFDLANCDSSSAQLDRSHLTFISAEIQILRRWRAACQLGVGPFPLRTCLALL
jgi:hypothetical protein